jgi:hypothetical protein
MCQEVVKSAVKLALNSAFNLALGRISAGKYEKQQ